MVAWEYVRGPTQRTTVKCNAGAVVTAKYPVTETGGLVTHVADGGTVDGVMRDTASAVSEDNLVMDKLVPGSVWKVNKASGALTRGTPVAAAASQAVDGGSSTNRIVGKICDADAASADTTCYVYIEYGTIA